MKLTPLHNYKVKLIAFIFAVFIWFFVVTENQYETTVTVPIRVVNIPEGKILLNDVPDAAKFKVVGSGKDLIALNLSSTARLDLDASVIVNAKTFVLEPRDINFARAAVSLAAEEVVMPESIAVILDDFMSKKVPTSSHLRVSVAPGYTAVGELQLSPDSIIIAGPKSIVSKISEAATVATELKNVESDLNEIVDLELAKSRRVELATDKVNVFWDIQRRVELPISGIPVEVRNAPKDMTIYVVPSTLSLVLEGGGETLAKIDRKDLIAYVDYDEVRKSPASQYPAVIEGPPGITYRDRNPSTFKLVFERKPTSQ